ncbi:hypothetical protein [Ignatzschineria sp. LJL83]
MVKKRGRKKSSKRRNNQRVNPSQDYSQQFSLFLFPILVILPAVLVMMFVDLRLEIAIDELNGRGGVVDFLIIFLLDIIQYLSFATILSLILYRFRLSVFTLRNYLCFSLITLLFISLWSLFKGDLDWVYSFQRIPLDLYIVGYVLVFPMYAVVIFLSCLVLQKGLDQFSSVPFKEVRYLRIANYVPNYLFAVTISYFLLKMGYGDGKVSSSVFSYRSIYYLLIILSLGVVVLVASWIGDKEYQDIEFKKMIKGVFLLTILIVLITALMD